MLNKDLYDSVESAELAHKMFCRSYKQRCKDNNIRDDSGKVRSCKFCKFAPVQNCKMVWMFSDCEDNNKPAYAGAAKITNSKDCILISVPKDAELLRVILAFTADKEEASQLNKQGSLNGNH